MDLRRPLLHLTALLWLTLPASGCPGPCAQCPASTSSIVQPPPVGVPSACCQRDPTGTCSFDGTAPPVGLCQDPANEGVCNPRDQLLYRKLLKTCGPGGTCSPGGTCQCANGYYLTTAGCQACIATTCGQGGAPGIGVPMQP